MPGCMWNLPRVGRASFALAGVCRESSLFPVPGPGWAPTHVALQASVWLQTKHEHIDWWGCFPCTSYIFATHSPCFVKWEVFFSALFLGCLSLFMQLSLPGVSSFLPTIYLNHACFRAQPRPGFLPMQPSVITHRYMKHSLLWTMIPLKTTTSHLVIKYFHDFSLSSFLWDIFRMSLNAWAMSHTSFTVPL